MVALMNDEQLEVRRAAARRTAIWLAGLAAGIFTAFLLTGGRGK
jgi:hypothetical protein